MSVPPIPVSVVIATRNSAKTLRLCLSSLSGFSKVVVVDNFSKDESAEIAREHGAEVVSERNAGFFGAYDLGFRRTSSDFVMFLDADAYLEDFDIGAATSSFRNPSVGMVVCMAHAPVTKRKGLLNWAKLMDDVWWWRMTQTTKYTTGRFQVSWLDRQFSKFFMSKGIGSGSTTTGPCYIMRRRALLEIGGMDPRADDFVLRRLLENKGFQVRFYQSSSVLHFARPTLRRLMREFLQYGLRGSQQARHFYSRRERLEGAMMMVLSMGTAPFIAKNAVDPRHLFLIPVLRLIQASSFSISSLFIHPIERLNYAS